jgi:transposase
MVCGPTFLAGSGARAAVARKLTVLCWHMLTKETDYLWARVKELRNQDMRVAEQAQKSYEHFVEAWRPRPVKGKGARAPQSGKA